MVCEKNGGNKIVGHLPKEVSRITKFILDRGAVITACTGWTRGPL